MVAWTMAGDQEQIPEAALGGGAGKPGHRLPRRRSPKKSRCGWVGGKTRVLLGHVPFRSLGLWGPHGM